MEAHLAVLLHWSVRRTRGRLVGQTHVSLQGMYCRRPYYQEADTLIVLGLKVSPNLTSAVLCAESRRHSTRPSLGLPRTGAHPPGRISPPCRTTGHLHAPAIRPRSPTSAETSRCGSCWTYATGYLVTRAHVAGWCPDRTPWYSLLLTPGGRIEGGSIDGGSIEGGSY
jgi:hypothetical protein